MSNIPLGINAVCLLMLIKVGIQSISAVRGSIVNKKHWTCSVCESAPTCHLPFCFFIFIFSLFNSNHHKAVFQSIIILKETGNKCAFLKQGQEALVSNSSEILTLSGWNTFISTQHTAVILSMENSLLMPCFMVLLIKAQVLLFRHFLQQLACAFWNSDHFSSVNVLAYSALYIPLHKQFQSPSVTIQNTGLVSTILLS